MSVNDPLLNIVFYCLRGNRAGVISLDVQLTGAPLSRTFTGDATIELELTVGGSAVGASFGGEEGIVLSLGVRGEGITNSQRTNWVGWSKIGEVGFELDATNIAGFRPMAWSGMVYAILPLDKNAIVYGSEGVTLMYPVSEPMATFGFKDLTKVGLWSKDAVCGTSSQHFFINKVGKLWKLDGEGGLKLLDYSEYLGNLVNPTLHYDEYYQRLLVGDEDVGYTLTLSGLGGGYENLSGFAYVDGEVIVTSPGLIPHRAMDFTTDIIDFKYRGMKSIESVQVGVDTNEGLFVAYDYRFSKDAEFRSTPWTIVNKEGVAHLKASGVEFRIRVRALLAHEFDVDYITIQFKNIDRRFTRGPRESVG